MRINQAVKPLAQFGRAEVTGVTDPESAARKLPRRCPHLLPFVVCDLPCQQTMLIDASLHGQQVPSDLVPVHGQAEQPYTAAGGGSDLERDAQGKVNPVTGR